MDKQIFAGVHALKGCDSASLFALQGILSTLKLFKGNRTFPKSFKSLETFWDVAI